MSVPDVTRSVSSTSTDYRCRYCYGTSDGWASCEPLISPCRCRGSMAFVHKTCLEKWLNIKNVTSCDCCQFQFDTMWVYKPITEWEYLEMPLEDILLVMLTITMYATFTLQFLGAAYIALAANVLDVAVLSITMTALCLGLVWFLVGCISLTVAIYTSDYWTDWRRVNKRRIILLRIPEPKDNLKPLKTENKLTPLSAVQAVP